MDEAVVVEVKSSKTHLVEVEHKVQFTHVVEILIQHLESKRVTDEYLATFTQSNVKEGYFYFIDKLHNSEKKERLQHKPFFTSRGSAQNRAKVEFNLYIYVLLFEINTFSFIYFQPYF